MFKSMTTEKPDNSVPEVSRQLARYRRIRASGKCARCGASVGDSNLSRCPKCMKKARLEARKKNGCKPKKKGKRGRPFKY
jgi:hypothetical protein